MTKTKDRNAHLNSQTRKATQHVSHTIVEGASVTAGISDNSNGDEVGEIATLTEEDVANVVVKHQNAAKRNLQIAENAARMHVWPHKKFIASEDLQKGLVLNGLFVHHTKFKDKSEDMQNDVWHKQQRNLERGLQRKRASVTDKMKVNFMSEQNASKQHNHVCFSKKI